MSTPPRPDLTEQPSKPDVLVRLHMVAKLYKGSAYLIEVVTDAIAVIEGLRESDARRLVMINDLKRDLADARPEEGR
jgi:hypothetical protein